MCKPEGLFNQLLFACSVPSAAASHTYVTVHSLT